MSDMDRDSSGDERGSHMIRKIPDYVFPQMPPPVSNMDEIMQNFVLSMAQHFQLRTGHSSQPRRSSRSSRRIALLSHFQKLDPPRYRGNEGPEAAEEWIRDLEKIFKVMGCKDVERVVLAVYSLKGEANHWWHVTKGALGDTSGVTWENFRRMFLDYYFPYAVRERKALEFERLTQGSITVAEYTAKFAELSKYAPYLVQYPVEQARRFERRLNPEIMLHLAPLRLEDYDEIYQRAQLIERTMRETRGYRMIQAPSLSSSGGKRPFRRGYTDQGLSKRSSASGSSSRRSSSGHSDGRSETAIYSRCGFSHWENICIGSGPICFRCRQSGHICRDCPLKQRQNPTEHPSP